MSNGNHLFLFFCHCEVRRNPIKLIVAIMIVSNQVIWLTRLYCYSDEREISSNESRKGNTNISINYLMWAKREILPSSGWQFSGENEKRNSKVALNNKEVHFTSSLLFCHSDEGGISSNCSLNRSSYYSSVI